MNPQPLTINHQSSVSVVSKLKDYGQFIKLRLSMLVVFGAVIGFVIGSHEMDYTKMLLLIAGGFLVTGSSNGFNQIIERDVDKLMSRTQNRPLPQGRMSLNEAYLLATLSGIAGIAILYLYTNTLSAFLGFIALFLYTLVYTPMKRKTPFAVFVGAFPGAIPPMLGYIAATNDINFNAWILFLIQFIWQFPHFWAIAWVLDEDYKKAGFNMLPSGNRDKGSAFQTLVYTLFLLPISLSPVVFNMSGSISAIVISTAGVFFAWQAYVLYKECSVKAAQQLMFGSFLYLPVVQLAIMIGK